jgi:hypothetical protein
MKYGRDMMRYGFHEMRMPGGTNKYPGYYSDLSEETIKKLNAEQESFIRATEDHGRTKNVTWSNGSYISNTGTDGNNPHMAA